MAKGLLRDINIETLYAMRREENLNNQEIADRLGVSYTTIYNLIGRQPKELRKKPCGYERKTVPVTVQHSEPEPEPCLVVEARGINLLGLFGSYVLDTKLETITVRNAAGQSFEISKDMLGDFINELTAIKRKLPEIKHENEMW